MAESLHAKIRRKALIAGGLLVLVLAVGTAAYKYIGGEKATLLDSLYMVVITIATIGYGEIIDLSHSPGGRIFTMFLSFAGIGIMTYIMMSLTAFVVEGELNEAFRRRKMEKRIEKLSDHYIVCGADGVGTHVARELLATQRPYIVVDVDREKIERLHGGEDGPAFVVGDATDNETLEKAGIGRAHGLFAVTGDDNQNMVISLSARQLNPKIRVVARCEERAQQREDAARRRGLGGLADAHRRPAHRLGDAAPGGGELPRRHAAARGPGPADRGAGGARGDGRPEARHARAAPLPQAAAAGRAHRGRLDLQPAARLRDAGRRDAGLHGLARGAGAAGDRSSPGRRPRPDRGTPPEFFRSRERGDWRFPSVVRLSRRPGAPPDCSRSRSLPSASHIERALGGSGIGTSDRFHQGDRRLAPAARALLAAVADDRVPVAILRLGQRLRRGTLFANAVP